MTSTGQNTCLPFRDVYGADLWGPAIICGVDTDDDKEGYKVEWQPLAETFPLMVPVKY